MPNLAQLITHHYVLEKVIYYSFSFPHNNDFISNIKWSFVFLFAYISLVCIDILIR